MLEEMQQQGVIEPSHSPWALLEHKNDGSLWFCVDYHNLNNITRKDSYPLPRVCDVNLTKYFWADAVSTVVYLKTMLYKDNKLVFGK